MNTKSVLSICIPTYNRGAMLEKSIRNMVKVCEESNILIYVSDNASLDDTEDRMLRLREEFDFIQYHRHQKNIGSDDNFEFVLKMPNTKYRWLMSDTCYVDNVGSLVIDLVTNEWDGYVLNDPSTRAKYLPSNRVVYDDARIMISEIGWHLTWISCMIYNESLINSFDFRRYKNSCFNQTALMFEPTANRTSKICFNPYLVVKNLPVEKESGWHYHVFDVLYRQWYLLIMSLPLYYEYEVKKKCIEDAASKPTLLTMRFHAMRRIEGKWSWKDVYRNRFFIKQANGHYFCLLFIGFCSGYMIKKFFLWGHYVKDLIRFFGVKI